MKHGTTYTKTARTVFVCALLMAPALSAEIYRWTDENGVTHFSQTPPPSGQEAEIADVPDTAGDAAAEGSGIDFDRSSGQLPGDPDGDGVSAADQRRRELAEQHAQRRVEEAKLRAECQRARSRLDRIEPNRRVYYTDEEGETVRMDDAERVAEVEQLYSFLDQNCP